MNWKPLRKIIASALSGLTTTGVITGLDSVGVTVDQGWAALIVAAATVLAGYLVPEREQRRG